MEKMIIEILKIASKTINAQGSDITILTLTEEDYI